MTSLTENDLVVHLALSQSATSIGRNTRGNTSGNTDTHAAPEQGNDADSAKNAIVRAVQDYGNAVAVVATATNDGLAVETHPQISLGDSETTGDNSTACYAYAPTLRWSQLGDTSFCRDHKLRFAYMCGAMANGIASAEMVVAAAKAGILGSYGAAGQSIQAIETAIEHITSNAPDLPFSINLIHSPNEPEHESKVVDLFIKHDIRLIEASAYLGLTAAVVRYRLHGIHRDENGCVVAPNKIIGKASRIEVATRWWSPAPQKIVDALLQSGQISAEAAELSRHVPMAQDLTAEADSGGHTDNRPALCMFPSFLSLKNKLQETYGYPQELRLGLGGGIGSPSAAAAAYSMGAAFIVTGSINQACHESGSSDGVRSMLSQVEQADVCMAPAADMFEMGVKLQVLKRGTMFPMRAEKLYTLYRSCASLEDIPTSDRAQLEKQYFRKSIDEIWQETERFFLEREPKQVEKAHRDPKHKMALVFRWYLGKSSRWANAGESDRAIDYQVWCGAAMGAFNEWCRDSFLADPAARSITCVAYNILHACCVHIRCNQLQLQGIKLSNAVTHCPPQTLETLKTILATQHDMGNA